MFSYPFELEVRSGVPASGPLRCGSPFHYGKELPGADAACGKIVRVGEKPAVQPVDVAPGGSTGRAAVVSIVRSEIDPVDRSARKLSRMMNEINRRLMRIECGNIADVAITY